MIIDSRIPAGPGVPDPAKYSVVDASTGESLDKLGIFYADDDKGIVRHYVLDEKGDPTLNADGTAYKTNEIDRPIRILPRVAPAADPAKPATGSLGSTPATPAKPDRNRGSWTIAKGLPEETLES